MQLKSFTFLSPGWASDQKKIAPEKLDWNAIALATFERFFYDCAIVLLNLLILLKIVLNFFNFAIITTKQQFYPHSIFFSYIHHSSFISGFYRPCSPPLLSPAINFILIFQNCVSLNCSKTQKLLHSNIVLTSVYGLHGLLCILQDCTANKSVLLA